MIAYKNEFVIYLEKLKDELLKYSNEADIWKLTDTISNTPANLALHVCGNLKHNIGTIMGNNGFVRTRDAEFTIKGLSRDEVIAEIDATIEMIAPVLEGLKPEDLNKPFPGNAHEEWQTFGSILAKIAHHFGYHLGQINYHRRLLSK
jgi:uncharacterized protein DUF1572